MNKSIKLLCGIVVIGMFGCGGGGSGGSSFNGPINSAGFPQVAGRYSLNTESANADCGDDGSAEIAPIAANYVITQVDNQLVQNGTGSTQIPGATILENQPATGNVEKDGSFVTTARVTAQLTNVSGVVVYTFIFDGQFLNDGWVGDVNITFSTSNATCRATTPFNGDKIG